MVLSQLPTSGKTAYMIWRDNREEQTAVHTPIFMWSINSSKSSDPPFYTSASENYPIRPHGRLDNFLYVTGPEYRPSFLFNYITTFNFGLHQIDVGHFKPDDFSFVLEYGMFVKLKDFQLNFFYSKGNLVDFNWGANFIIYEFTDEDTLYSDADDQIICLNKMCEQKITTTDISNYPEGLSHVRRATINWSSEFEIFRSSFNLNSPDLLLNHGGLEDKTVELEVIGDFSYWYDLMYNHTIHDYKFYYGPDEENDFWPAKKMVVQNVSNLVVDTSTRDVISAIVQLGANYQ